MPSNLTSLSGNIKLNVNVTSQAVDDFPSTPNDPITWSDNTVVTYDLGGTSGDDQVYRVSGTVSTAATVDLTSGGLYNAFGQQVNFQSVTILVLKNTSETDYLDVTWGTILDTSLAPGGVLYLSTPGMTPADIVFAESGTGDATYDLVVVGVQA